MIDLALSAQVLIWLIVLGVFLASGQASIYHPLAIYLGFHAIVFMVRPFLVYYLNFDEELLYMHLQVEPQLFTRVLMVSSFGLIVFAMMSIGFGWCAPQFRTPGPAPFTIEQRQALLILSIILAPVIAFSIHQSHTNFLMENRGGTYVTTGAGGYTIEAQYMAGPMVCAFIAMTRFRWYALALLIPYVGYRAYSGMSRWTFVLIFVALGLMYSWLKRFKWVSPWLLLSMVPIFFIFKVVGDNRTLVKRFVNGEEYHAEERVPLGSSPLDKFKIQYDGPDFSNFDFLAFVVAAVPDRTGTFTYGTQYLQLFTEPIPRKLWPGKPAGAPIGFFNLNNYGDFLGRTVSLVGDGWMSGGWTGVAVTMGLAGALLGMAHRWFWKHAGDNMASLFYLVGLAMLPQWFRDGGISIAKFLFWNLSPLALWLALSWLLGRRSVAEYSVLLPRNTRARLVSMGAGQSGDCENS
jgi:hypothetical protein